MRKHWNHHAPSSVQPTPADNTSAYIRHQVSVWVRGGSLETAHPYGPLIHPECAMEIAAWWQEDGNAFAQFASTGTISNSLTADVTEYIDLWAGATGAENIAERDALCALLAYLQAASPN